MNRDSIDDKIFNIINLFFLTVLLVAVAYPLYFVIIASFSSPTAVNTGKVWFIPKDISFSAYEYVFKYEDIWIGYRNTIVLTVVGTIINLALTFTGAYALSKSNLPLIRPVMFLFTFTMFFSGGLIPQYILCTNLGLRNTMWSMILPGAVSCYNLILTRTYYLKSIPGELIQASKIDGCSDARAFWSVVLPLSTPILATMALFYGVGHWNQFFNALIYISDRAKYPLQLVLREILLVNQEATTSMMGGIVDMRGSDAAYLAEMVQRAEILKYAIIIVASVPVLVVYPFLQRYFLKGIMMGSLKG